MYYPAHIDGQSVVVLRQGALRFHALESGVLRFDGETLWFCNGGARREFTDVEQDRLLLVSVDSRIPECRGFHFFLLNNATAS